MTDTSKYPHQSMMWILFIVFVLFLLSGVYYYSQGNVCYNEHLKIPLSGIYSNTQVNVQSCYDACNVGILLLVVSLLSISSLGVVYLIPEKRVKCPKCGYQFGDD
jgi:hypothetical protein